MIELAYVALQRGPTTRIQIESTDEEYLHYPDLQFKERYTKMRKENQQYKGYLNISSIENNQVVALDAASLAASFKDDNSHYLSMKDMSSSRNKISSDLLKRKNTDTLHYHQDKVLIPRIDQKDEIDFRCKYMLSPGCSGHKRFFSFSGFDPTPLLQPERVSKSMRPGKSYPNHLYMMFLSDSKTRESSEHGSLKEEIELLKSQN